MATRPLQLLVVGQVDDAEAALTQESLDPVATDVLGQVGFPGHRVRHLGKVSLRTFQQWLPGQQIFNALFHSFDQLRAIVA